MADFKSKEASALASLGDAHIEFKRVGGKVRVYKNEFDLDSQATASTLTCQQLPKNGYIVGIVLHGTSLSTAKVKIGDKDDDDAYFAEATVTAATFTCPAVIDYCACDGETPVVTTSTAALPSSGSFFVDFLVAENR